MSLRLVFLSTVSIALALSICASLAEQPAASPKKQLAPIPEKLPASTSNPSSAEKIELGKLLFFDPRLSGSNRVSCASCHRTDKMFADGRRRAEGPGGKLLPRNTPSLLHVGLHKSLFWDGRSSSLEQQALIPIQSPLEMDQDLDELVKELSGIDGYAGRFRQVFGRPLNKQDIGRALAAFQRTLITRKSPLDRYLAGDKSALSAAAQTGLELFVGDAGCIRCHHGPLLSDDTFYRLGVGRGDRGRGAVTGKRQDLYKFRTPSLREVAGTGPYMHDGSQATLFDVVQYYYRGVPRRGPEGLALDVEALVDRSFSEIDALVAFLKSLSGEPLQIEPPKLP